MKGKEETGRRGQDTINCLDFGSGLNLSIHVWVLFWNNVENKPQIFLSWQLMLVNLGGCSFWGS